MESPTTHQTGNTETERTDITHTTNTGAARAHASNALKSGSAAVTQPGERIPLSLIGSIVAVGSLAFVGILTETVMTVLFPQLMVEFHVDTATVQWITTIYLLVVAATMPLSSYLNRRFKLRTLFIAAVVLAVTGSLIMIVGHAFPLILLARVIQGVGSGVATPLMMNIILQQAPRSKVGQLMGVGSLVITVAPAIGPTVGGAISSVLPWRAIFVIVIPIVLLLSLPVGLKCIRQTRPTEAAQLNPLQFAAIVLALCGLIFSLNQAGVAVGEAVSGGSGAVRSAILAAVSLVVGVGSLLFFGWSSKRSFSPLIRLGWLRDPVVLLHLLPYLLMPINGIGFGYVITNVAQMSLGTSAFVAGALVLPGALIGAFFAPVGGMLYDRFGAPRPVLAAIGTATLGPVLLLVFSMHLTPGLLAGFYFIFGLCYALGYSNIMTSALSGIDHEFTPDGNAVFQTSLQFGGAVGTALFSTILGVAQAGAGEEGSAAFRHATAVGGACVFATMIVICVISIISLVAAFRIRAARQR
ncbi:MFS transporter [Bifidobacterium simiiventris]|uniref:MFS transporter n=1 Tax=Bifidobacterium simiiventris TaxID=2834434 RepID=UPI001C5A47E8|nr:MFS transporter [Bifidobacterium simiiventris]MBW3077915.1 MFS transporter [Bifidobacterium simiiventris]